MAAASASRELLARVESIKDGRKVFDQIFQMEKFLIKRPVAFFANPFEPVSLARSTLSLDHQADRSRRPPGRMRDARREKKNLPFSDRHVDDFVRRTPARDPGPSPGGLLEDLERDI